MPPYREQSARRAITKAEIVSRTAAGERLRHICAATAMPHIGTVWRWTAEDPVFAAAMTDARARATWPRNRFDEAKARAFLVRLADGETVGALQHDRAMPDRATLRCWRGTQAEFAVDVQRLIRVYRTERQHRQLRRPPPDWSEALADRVLLMLGRGHACRQLRRLDPSLPAYLVVRRWQRERPEFDDEVRVNMRMGRLARERARRMARLQPLLDGIVSGGSLNSLGGKNGLPSHDALYRWAARDPDVARQIARACDQREDWYTDQIQIIAEDVERIGIAEARRRMAPLSRQLGQLSRRPGKKWLG